MAEPTVVEIVADQEPPPAFSNLWEFAVAVNRSDPTALALAANGSTAGIPIEGSEVRKLAGTVWFRGVVPKLSQEWRSRLLDALIETLEMPNHALKVGRRTAHLKELSYLELQEAARRSVPDLVRTDLELLITIGRLWGGDAPGRLRFTDMSNNHEPSKFMSLLGFRSPVAR